MDKRKRVCSRDLRTPPNNLEQDATSIASIHEVKLEPVSPHATDSLPGTEYEDPHRDQESDLNLNPESVLSHQIPIKVEPTNDSPCDQHYVHVNVKLEPVDGQAGGDWACDFCNLGFPEYSTLVEHLHSGSCTEGVDTSGGTVSEGFLKLPKLEEAGQEAEEALILPFPRRLTKVGQFNKYHCTYCRVKSKRGKEASLHRLEHKSDIEAGRPLYCCLYCTAKFATGPERNGHEDLHTRPYAPFPCPKCSQRFYIKSALQTHRSLKICEISEEHFTMKLQPSRSQLRMVTTWICRYCHIEVPETEVLRHFAAHKFCMPIESCDHCHHIITKRISTNKCLHSIPESEFKLSCEACQKLFRHHGCFRSHQERVHGNRYFRCTNCRTEFWFDETLTRHLKGSSYVCRGCKSSAKMEHEQASSVMVEIKSSQQTIRKLVHFEQPVSSISDLEKADTSTDIKMELNFEDLESKEIQEVKIEADTFSDELILPE